MFELPTITEVGRANEIILGIAAVGADLDGCWLPSGQEFVEDPLIPTTDVAME